jgi:hypothetical protein
MIEEELSPIAAVKDRRQRGIIQNLSRDRKNIEEQREYLSNQGKL